MLQCWLAIFEDGAAVEEPPVPVVVRLDATGQAAPAAVVVGRNPGCTLRPPGSDDGSDGRSRLVSREHLRLQAAPEEAGGLRLHDLRSSRGTEVEGRTPGSDGTWLVQDDATVRLGRLGDEVGAVLRLVRLERDPTEGVPEVRRPPAPGEGAGPRTLLGRSRLPDTPGIVLALDDQTAEFVAMPRGARKAIRLGWGVRCVPRLTRKVGPAEAAVVWRDGRDQVWLTSLCPAGVLWIDGVAPARPLDTVPLAGHERISVAGDAAHSWLFHAASLSAVDLDLQAYLAENPDAVIGRAADVALVLADPFVSRRHARVFRQGDQYLIQPLGGRSPTRVNGRPIAEATPLGDGDVIEIGSARIVVHGERLVESPSDRALPVAAVELQVLAAPGSPPRLADVTAHVPPGSLAAVCGPSGSGKSTLLAAVAGLVAPADGRVTVGRFDAAHGDALRGQVAFVPQDDRFLDGEWTAREALEWEARLAARRKVGEVQVDALVREVLGRVRLTSQEDVPVGALSGGQRRRLGVAMALLTRPRVLLADEPTSGLDRAAAREVLAALRAARDAGCTVLVATHDCSGWLGWSRVVLLCEGRVAFVGTPAAALAWFDCATPEDAIARLADPRGSSWAEKWGQTGAGAEGAHADPAPDDGPDRDAGTGRVHAVRRAARAAVLLARQRIARGGGLQLVRPAAWAAAAGLGIGWLGPEPRGGTWDVFLASLAALWFGVAPAVREVPDEAAWARLARRGYLRLAPYLLSRLSVLGFRAVVQAVVLTLALGITGAVPGHWAGAGTLLALLALNGTALGLLLGAAFGRSAPAQAALPALLVAQALLAAGGATSLPVRPTLTDWIGLMVKRSLAAEEADPTARSLSDAGGLEPLAPPASPSGVRGAVSSLAAARWAVEGLAHVQRHEPPEVLAGGEVSLAPAALAAVPDSLHSPLGAAPGPVTARYAAVLAWLAALTAAGAGAATGRALKRD